MRLQAIIGIVLLVLGLLSLVYGGISYTRREEILDLGPIEATAERRETIPLSPVIGVVGVVGGVVLLVVAARRK
jgi:hypothetical protein